MRFTKYLPFAAICLMMAGCGTGKQKAELTAGIKLANLDTTALPGSSFYQYACGGWIESHPLRLSIRNMVLSPNLPRTTANRYKV